MLHFLNMKDGKGRRKLEDGGPKKEFVKKVRGSARKFVKWQDVRGGAWRPLDQSGGFPIVLCDFPPKF